MQTVDPLLCDVKTAAAMLGVGRSLFYQMAADGRLGPVGIRLGKKRLFRLDELRKWVVAGCPTRERWLAKMEATNG